MICFADKSSTLLTSLRRQKRRIARCHIGRSRLRLHVRMPVQQHQQSIPQSAHLILLDHRQVPAFSLNFAESIPQAIAFWKPIIVIDLMPSGFALKDLRREIAFVLHQVPSKILVKAPKVPDVIQGQSKFTAKPEGDR